MRQALTTVAALLLFASAQGAFPQTTAPAQPQAGPGTSASPSAATPPAVSPDSTVPSAASLPAPAQPAPQPTVSAPPPPPRKQMSVSDLLRDCNMQLRVHVALLRFIQRANGGMRLVWLVQFALS